MSAMAHELESHAVRVALAFQAYKADRVRMASHDLRDCTHIAATRRGLFGVSRTGFRQITYGYYFGVTLRGNDLFAFEACDLPHGPTCQGRIVRLRLEDGLVTEQAVVAKGLDNGCHQIDFLRGQLHVVDTYNQQILRFSPDFAERETLSPLPVCPTGKWAKTDPQYRHVNSILAAGDRNLLLLHTGEAHTGGRSELVVYDQAWEQVSRWTLDGRWCHGLALLGDGTVLTCGSVAGEVISASGWKRKVSPLMTRGLAVGATELAVGGSRFAERGERIRSSGTITFLDHECNPLAEIELPGAPMELRRLDGRDRGLSSYLQELGPTAPLRVENAPLNDLLVTEPSALSPPARPFLRVGTATTTFPGDAEEARQQFARFHAMGVDAALEPPLLQTLLRMLETGTFVAGSPAPGFREVESPQRAGRVLNLALNRPELLRYLEDVTGCGPIKIIEGRVVQTLLRPGDELLWHDDLTHETMGRRLAIVINLSTNAYTGGDFQLRWKGGDTLVEHHHTDLGSALIFQVQKQLEHRVLPLTSGGPRRVFAGWAFAGDPQ